METDSPEFLRTLIAFFDNYGSEVRGHDAEAPDPETLEEIELFAEKKLPKEAWDGFFARMAARPECLRVLAARLGSPAIAGKEDGKP